MIRDLPPAPRGSRHAQALRLVTRAALAGLVALSVGLSSTQAAHADELDQQKKAVSAKIAQNKVDLDEANTQALAAAQALQQSQAALADAQAKLAKARSALQQSQALDRQRASELSVAQAALRQAQAEAAAALAAVNAWQKESGSRVRETMQQQNPLAGYGILFTHTTIDDLNQKVQWSTTVLDSTSAQMDRLTALKLKADAAQAQATQAEAKVAKLRAEAAAGLKTSQRLEAEASSAEQQVAIANAANAKAKINADAQVKAEQQRQVSLQAESVAVDRRIAARIAAQKAAAAKAERDRIAREKAAAAQRAKASTSSRAKTSSRSTSRPATSNQGSSSAAWIYPSGAAITSQYGMRLHPVLHYWKLHDGTDFGAACGSPIRAARAGVVAEKYYNAGYGNRLMIDHGMVNGRYVTTGYNHAIRYVVNVGQRVSQGQIIGYVGSTGYSTGCHLHLMVWVNGSVTNPMTSIY
ncbi:M23 family metallopeptidase [Aestuariimicrobium soli]|uniref:M23 family metallopeptidase n=1 Tax=Aestuariimicrobium soli TaxID=2035834 RepID=UPI003EB7E306